MNIDELKRKQLEEKLQPGTRVQLSSEFLRNTGQYTGDPAPCHSGGFARGEIVELDSLYFTGRMVAKVKWDDGKILRVNLCNLWPCGVLEPA